MPFFMIVIFRHDCCSWYSQKGRFPKISLQRHRGRRELFLTCRSPLK